jgi:hypothetical protein
MRRISPPPLRRLQEADDRGPGQRLARPRFPDDTQRLARRDVEAHPVDGAQDAAAGGEFHHEVADGEEGGARHRSLGFKASRSQSPRRFTDSASARSVIAGKRRIHHSPEKRNCCPIRISVRATAASAER